MPSYTYKKNTNKIVYDQSIDLIEQEIGASLIDRDALAKALQESWQQDKTKEKTEFLKAYQNQFRQVLEQSLEERIKSVYYDRLDLPLDYGKILSAVDKNLKMGAMALIPEIREDKDMLTQMSFGGIDNKDLVNDFTKVTLKYNSFHQAEKAVELRQKEAYEENSKQWSQMLVRDITALAYNQEQLAEMTEDEIIDYRLALSSYKTEMMGKKEIVEGQEVVRDQKIGEKEIVLLDEAISKLNKELKWEHELIVDNLGGVYHDIGQKVYDLPLIRSEVQKTFTDYKNAPHPIEDEIAFYKKSQESTNKTKKENEKSDYKTSITDDDAEMIGDFFDMAETEIDVKERKYVDQKIDVFNTTYKMKVNQTKFRTSIEQLSRLMVVAREEKESFLDPDNVIVIENGKETVYNAKEYYKDSLNAAESKRAEALEKLNLERKQFEDNEKKWQEWFQSKRNEKTEVKGNKQLENLENSISAPSPMLTSETEIINKTAADMQKLKKAKEEEFKKRAIDIEKEYKEDIKGVVGGYVLEKNGNSVRRYKTSEYYETHETAREQNVYKEFQLMYEKVFKETCHKEMERNYSSGKDTNFAKIAKDVDELCKATMFEYGLYDNAKNQEIEQKCSFGGFTPEQLSNIVLEANNGSWALDQNSEKAWEKQSSNAKGILKNWKEEEQKDKRLKESVNRVEKSLNVYKRSFSTGEIDKKRLLDHMIAAESHLQNTFSTRAKRFFNFRQYNREKKAILECRQSLGLGENDSLRLAMNTIYSNKIANVNKESVFNSMNNVVENTLSFQARKEQMAKENKQVRDLLLEEKQNQLNELRASGREPISIPDLDERKVILNQQPRSQPVGKNLQLQPNKDLKNVG